MKVIQKLRTVAFRRIDGIIFKYDEVYLLQVAWFNLRALLSGKFTRIGLGEKTASGSQSYKVIQYLNNRDFYFSTIRRGHGYAEKPRKVGQNIAESYAIDKLKFKDGDLVIDIGANWGTLKLFFDTRHEDLKIDYVGIEPGLDEYFCLERNVEVPSSRVFNIAIGEVSGRSLFYYSPLGADSSLVQPPEYDSTYEIDVLSLNDFLTREEFLDKRIRLLKLEAEGFEYEICKGASNIIQRIDYVAADLGWERGINRESPATEVIEFMIRHGFNIEKIGSVESLRFLFKNRTILD